MAPVFSEWITLAKKGDLVIVEWLDAWSSGGWGDRDDLDPIPVTTVGFFYKKNKLGVMIMSRQATGGQPGLPSFIPTKMIKKIRTIKVKI